MLIINILQLLRNSNEQTTPKKEKEPFIITFINKLNLCFYYYFSISYLRATRSFVRSFFFFFTLPFVVVIEVVHCELCPFSPSVVLFS